MKTVSLQQIRETLFRYMRDEHSASIHARSQGIQLAPAAVPFGNRTERLKRFLRRIPLLAPILVAAYRGLKKVRDRIDGLSWHIFRRIPLVSPILVATYRVIMLPGRVAFMTRRLENVYELQVGLTKLHGRIDDLSWHISALRERQETALHAADTNATRVQTIEGHWGDIATQTNEMMQLLLARSDSIDQRVDQVVLSGGETRKSLSDVSQMLGVLGTRSDSIDARLEQVVSSCSEIRDSLGESARMLVALHEKSDRYSQAVRAQIEAVKPVICAGENLVISRIDGFIMAFPAEEWRLPTYEILVGQLEPGLFARMKSTIREGMVVVDVGANVGTYTLLALRAIGARGKVFSYEPTPRAFDILKNNVQVNGFLESGRIELRQKAISDGSRSKDRFFVLKNSLTHNSLYGDDELVSDNVDVIEVDTVSLDQELGVDQRVDVVKIDAEGAEPAILRGMRRVIEHNPAITIYIEFAPEHLKRAKVDMLLYLAEIRSQGFDIQEVTDPTGELRALSDEELCTCFSVNLMLRKAN